MAERIHALVAVDAGLDGRVALYLVFLSLETAVMDDAQGDQLGVVAALAELRDRLAGVERR